MITRKTLNEERELKNTEHRRTSILPKSFSTELSTNNYCIELLMNIKSLIVNCEQKKDVGQE